MVLGCFSGQEEAYNYVAFRDQVNIKIMLNSGSVKYLSVWILKDSTAVSSV